MKLLTLVIACCGLLSGQESDLPHHFLGRTAPLTPASSDPPARIARRHLESLAAALSLDRAALDGIYLAGQYRTGHNGVTHIVFRQRFQGADVLNAEWVVNIDGAGRVLNAGGRLYAAPPPLSVPSISRAPRGVRAAVRAVDPNAGDFAPLVSTEAPRAPGRIRYAGGPLPLDVEGRPVWYALRGRLQPAWNFFVAHSDRRHRYSVTVDDASEAVLDQQPLTFFQNPAPPRGMVFERESPQPMAAPGIRATAAPPLVPRTMQSFKGDPIASPLGWTTGAQTAGNNTVAGENLPGADFLRPVPSSSTGGEFSFPLELGPGSNPLDYRDAATANLFYWVNRAHDLHYQYGFDEAAGNFQADNLGRGGVGGDAVYAYTHFGAQGIVAGSLENAFFSLQGSTDDGVQPEISMFLSAAQGARGDYFTDGAYDAQVIVHEYTHGVSLRLARQAYTAFQGRAMGEAWSDFYALEYTTPEGGPTDGIYPIGQYFDQSWGYGGARSRPYSTSLDSNPLTFADLGHVGTAPEVHADGEIWVEALWEIRANLIRQFGEHEGRERVRRLIIDGMKLAVPAASMVDMRDAILLADRVDYNGQSQDQLWAGFAKRGLGALAWSDGAATAHVLASFDPPSSTGAIRFYDDPIVIGEDLRIVLEDAGYNEPTVLIQVTSTSGDLENVILHQRGSVYVGTLRTRTGAVTRGNTLLEVVPEDYIGAYYVDRNASGAAKLVQASAATMPPYAVSASPPAFAFANENRLNVPNGSFATLALPFAFPFFDRHYGAAMVYSSGLIAFDRPAQAPVCSDAAGLRSYPGLAALWLQQMSLNGVAQPNEGLFVSTTFESMTFRWAGEHTPLAGTPSPVNFAATLFNDGRIAFSYGAGNTTVPLASTLNQCGPAVYGVSNGHGAYSQTGAAANYTNRAVTHFDPPYGNSSLPDAAIVSPRPGDRVQDILRVNGTVSDRAAFVVSVDIFIDGQQRARAVPSGVAQAWAAVLNLPALGLEPGEHRLSIRVLNGRGGFSDLPAAPVNFTMLPGRSSPPVISIERPEDPNIKGAFLVSGYAYDQDLRVSTVDTLIDGFVYPITLYGLRRTDICDALPDPKPLNCPQIGFSGTFNTLEAFPPIPDGPHKLQVRVLDQAGRFTFYPETPLDLNVNNGPPAKIVGVLESPAAGATLSGTVTVSGYAYSPGRRIVSATVLVDGQSAAGARVGLPMPDVCAALPEADACPNIGFTAALNTVRFLNGPHILGIRAINDRGDSIVFPALVRNGMNVRIEN